MQNWNKQLPKLPPPFGAVKVTVEAMHPGFQRLEFAGDSCMIDLRTVEPIMLKAGEWTPLPLGFRSTFSPMFVAMVTASPERPDIVIRPQMRRPGSRNEWGVFACPCGLDEISLPAKSIVAAVTFVPVFRPSIIEGEV